MQLVKKILAALLVVLLSQTAYAEQKAENTNPNVHFAFAPYLWLTSIDGTVGARGFSTKLDVSFSDIRRHIDFAAFIAADLLLYNKFGISTDISAAFLSDQKYREGIRLSGDTKLLVSDVFALYRLGTLKLGENNAVSMTVDLLAGARIWDVGLELDLETPFMGSHNVSRSRSWVDPQAGLRTEIDFNNQWRMRFQGGIGGGGNTSKAWDAAGYIGYSFWKHGTLLAGYKAVSVNRRQGNDRERFVFDVTIHGPVLGLQFTF